MRTVALRFADNIAPPEGTIETHRRMIDTNGFVWYGKLGLPISAKTKTVIMNNRSPRILLIHSGGTDRYWAYIDRIQNIIPAKQEFPSYYGELAESMKTWFRVLELKKAEGNVMSKCVVSSSGAILSSASRHSMSPYFIIDYDEE